MRKTITSAALALTCITMTSSAEVLTVDNAPGSVVMFTTMSAAYEAAKDGDTILVTGSATSYGTLDVYKRLTIIGSGYFLEDAENQNDIPGLTRKSTALNLRFRSDLLIGSSSSSRVIGLSGRIWSDAGVDDLVVERCHLTSVASFGGKTVLRSCFGAGNSDIRIGSGSLITNSIVNNLSLGLGSSASHCVILRLLSFDAGASISNAIFETASATPLTGSISNSMAIGNSILPEGAGNINDQAHLAVFVNSSSPDAMWQLKEGSPAAGAGTGGADMGPFGGANPYRLSGVPGIPRVTRLVVPATATSSSGLQFEVDAQAFAE